MTMMEKFNEDMILQDMAFHRDLNKWASHAIVDIFKKTVV